MGFQWFVLDYTAINELIPHGFANMKNMLRNCNKSWVDLDMMSGANRLYLEDLVKNGKVDISLVNDACRKILLAKFKLGLLTIPLYIVMKVDRRIIYRRIFRRRTQICCNVMCTAKKSR